jgi:hypothetical protein
MRFEALNEFWHFDPWGWRARDDDDEFLCDLVEDDILRQVIEKGMERDKNSGISFLFGIKR